VVEQLLTLMVEDRRGQWGEIDFAEAWSSNLPVVLRDVRPRREREAWSAALSATRSAWEIAWNGGGSSTLVQAEQMLSEPD
jgi:hypothetical protein